MADFFLRRNFSWNKAITHWLLDSIVYFDYTKVSILPPPALHSTNRLLISILSGIFADKRYKTIQGLNNLTFVLGQKQNLKLVLGGYSYTCTKKAKDSLYYMCSRMRRYNCKTQLVMNKKKDQIRYRSLEHDHPPDFDE